jgi:ribonuclease VapC
VSSVVLDASALIAVLTGEPGGEKLTPRLLDAAIVSTVNLAEVQGRLVRGGADPNEAWENILAPIREAAEFTPEQARIAGSLIAETRALGLSLGDRACLALGMTLNSAIYTADRSWKNLKLGLRIHMLR